MDLKEWIHGFGSVKKEEKGGGGGGGVAMNLIGMKFVCFSHFFYAFLCLCCLWTRVRTLGTVCVYSQSFEIGFVLCLFFWIPDSLRKVVRNFESLSQSPELVGKPNQLVH